MIDIHTQCIEALKGCRFQAGSTPKRFVSDMQKYIDRPSDLTVGQIQYLYKLTWNTANSTEIRS